MAEYFRFRPGDENPPGAIRAAVSLDALLQTEKPDQSYSQMMRSRLAGNAARWCDDTYFLASENGICVSRLWYGWGRHPDAVGNFGNFKTDPAFRGKGIGATLLEHWFADLANRSQGERPIALFCTSAQSMIDRHYGKYGFRPAITPGCGGPTYCPLGDAPETFAEFCEDYYRPGNNLRFVAGDIGWRHEIDCLLRFALMAENKDFGLPSAQSYEEAWLHVRANPRCGKLECILDAHGHAVGWAFTPQGRPREICLHSRYTTAMI